MVLNISKANEVIINEIIKASLFQGKLLHWMSAITLPRVNKKGKHQETIK